MVGSESFRPREGAAVTAEDLSTVPVRGEGPHEQDLEGEMLRVGEGARGAEEELRSLGLCDQDYVELDEHEALEDPSVDLPHDEDEAV